MKAVGIICEYNPFHNGHVYHIQMVKKMFPDSILVLVLNGYFLERGEVSLLSKSDKTMLALSYGVDLILELPVVFGTQSADVFATKAIEILHHFQVSDVVFGSESNDIERIIEMAKKQLDADYSMRVQEILKTGVNYPTALAKALDGNAIDTPNDLLGISYAKAVLKSGYPITLHTIQRTNDYHDTLLSSSIISASNIRHKLTFKEDISLYVPEETTKCLRVLDEKKLWELLRFRILTDPHLNQYMTVDEGIEHRLKKCILQASNLDEFVSLIKTKRYTYNKIHRMMIHLLLGFTKEMNDSLEIDYIRVLGFNKQGQLYLNAIKKDITLPLQNKKSKIYQMEEIAAIIYDYLTNSEARIFEIEQKPVIDFSNPTFDNFK